MLSKPLQGYMHRRTAQCQIAILSLLLGIASCRQSQPGVSIQPATESESSSPQTPTRDEPRFIPDIKSEFGDWVALQLETHDATLINIVDQKPWLQSSVPNTTAVLGVAKKKATGLWAKYREYQYFSFVLLAQSQAAGRMSSPKLIGLDLNTDLIVPGAHPQTINVSPIQIRADEYAFGVEFLAGSVGNKGGELYGMMSLYRYHDNELREIFRDVIWVYSKYSDPDFRSCNVDMFLDSEPTPDSDFYAITRNYNRSYFGESKNPEFTNISSTAVRVADHLTENCSLTNQLKNPNTHKWNPSRHLYVDTGESYLDRRDFGIGGLFNH
jgi:hypothetical protein